MPKNLPPDRSQISTERRNPRTRSLHTKTVAECVELINAEDRQVFVAMKRASARLTRFIGAVEPGFVAGGRLIYLGAGTSGRLGVLDASEAPPTFCVPSDRIIGLIAGGDRSLKQSSEGGEDEPDGAHAELAALGLTSRDTVLGIAAGGTTPYVLGALDFCKHADLAPEAGPITGLLTCATIEKPASVDHLITLKTGAEVIAGSTRMKAGTATKLALNTISTTLMIRAGKVYDQLMVDVRASNAKLRDRGARIVMTLTGLAREEAFDLLDRAKGSAKAATVMHRLRVDLETAESRLHEAQDRLDVALGEAEASSIARS
jgi:N-acetylmuramic acid 6-phosphate etherase